MYNDGNQKATNKIITIYSYDTFNIFITRPLRVHDRLIAILKYHINYQVGGICSNKKKITITDDHRPISLR